MSIQGRVVKLPRKGYSFVIGDERCSYNFHADVPLVLPDDSA